MIVMPSIVADGAAAPCKPLVKRLYVFPSCARPSPMLPHD